MSRRVVISLVEDGWQSARMLSMALVRDAGVDVTHYIKGRIEPSVRRLIAPEPPMRIVPVARRWFKPAAGVALAAALWRRRLAAVIVDNARTAQWAARWARWARVPLVEAEEQFRRLTYRWDGASLAGDAVVARLRSLASPCAAR